MLKLCIALLALAPTALAWSPSFTSVSPLRLQEQALCRQRGGMSAAHMVVSQPGKPANLSRSSVRRKIEVRRRCPMPTGVVVVGRVLGTHSSCGVNRILCDFPNTTSLDRQPAALCEPGIYADPQSMRLLAPKILHYETRQLPSEGTHLRFPIIRA